MYCIFTVECISAKKKITGESKSVKKQLCNTVWKTLKKYSIYLIKYPSLSHYICKRRKRPSMNILVLTYITFEHPSLRVKYLNGEGRWNTV